MRNPIGIFADFLVYWYVGKPSHLYKVYPKSRCKWKGGDSSWKGKSKIWKSVEGIGSIFTLFFSETKPRSKNGYSTISIDF